MSPVYVPPPVRRVPWAAGLIAGRDLVAVALAVAGVACLALAWVSR